MSIGWYGDSVTCSCVRVKEDTWHRKLIPITTCTIRVLMHFEDSCLLPTSLTDTAHMGSSISSSQWQVLVWQDSQQPQVGERSGEVQREDTCPKISPDT